MSEGITCIRNKCTSDYKSKVLITIFHLNKFGKRDINDMEGKKRSNLLVESLMSWLAYFFVNNLIIKVPFLNLLHFSMKTKQRERGG